MNEKREIAPQVQEAVEFFTSFGLKRILQRLREKYIEVGDVGGQVIITDSTADERCGLASFLAKAPFQEGQLKVR